MSQQRFADQFACPKAGKQVAVYGVEVRLHGSGGLPVAGERVAQSCSGSPGCGTTIGAPNCPYAANRNTAPS